MTPTVVACDPGGKASGVVTRRGGELVDFMLLVRHPDDDIVSWSEQVCGEVIRQFHAAHKGHELWNGAQKLLVACEALNPPTPQMGTIALQGLFDTAMVVGGLIRTFGRQLVLVPPGGHGSGPRQAYPDPLWGVREKKGTGVLSHCRSAFDVAGAAATMVKMGVTDASL